MSLSPSQCPALVLNADFRPLSTYPLALMSWMESVTAMLQDKVIVVENYDRFVRSERLVLQIPSVVALKHHIDQSRIAPLSRLGVFVRDRFCCAYCRRTFRASELTFDHVVPRCLGGASTWTNLVAACADCNARKGSKSVKAFGVVPATPPWAPTLAELNAIGAGLRRQEPLDRTWQDWVYWNVELDP